MLFYSVVMQHLSLSLSTGCLRNYRKSKLQLRTSVLGRLRDLQYIFTVIYETLCLSHSISLFLSLFLIYIKIRINLSNQCYKALHYNITCNYLSTDVLFY